MRTASATRSQGFVRGVGGLRLHYHAWEVPRPRGALVVVHGLAEHAGRYDATARRLAVHGFASYAVDLRGHGRSEGRRGYVRRFDVFLQDLERFRREVAGLADPDCPLFLLGHSMGGLIALRYLQEYDDGFRGAVLCSPWLTTAFDVPRWKTMLASALSPVLPALPIRARIPAEHLTHDSDEVLRYQDDPLVHDTVTPRLFSEVSDAMGLVLRRRDRLRRPLLFLVGGADHLVQPERTITFARSLGGDVDLEVFPGLYHEVLNEPEYGAVLDRIRGWLCARL